MGTGAPVVLHLKGLSPARLDNLDLHTICKIACFHITLAQVYEFLSSHLGTGLHPRIFCRTPSSFSLSLFDR